MPRDRRCLARAAAHSFVHLDDPRQLVVRPAMPLLIRLRDKFGHQRLVGSPGSLP